MTPKPAEKFAERVKTNRQIRVQSAKEFSPGGQGKT
jgi:hypothetical protein